MVPYVQFCGYKGNYFNYESCYGFRLDQPIVKDPHTMVLASTLETYLKH